VLLKLEFGSANPESCMCKPADPRIELSVCSTCPQSAALLADLEDLCSWVPNATAHSRGCVAACGRGPNVLSVKAAELYTDAEREGRQLHTGVDSVDKALTLLQALSDLQNPGSTAPVDVPDVVLARIRLRSDAMRLSNSRDAKKLECSERLLTQAIEAEREAPGPVGPKLTQAQATRWRADHLRSLLLLRSHVRGSQAFADYAGAIEDCDAMIAAEPLYSRAHLQKGRMFQRSRQPALALDSFERALALGRSQSSAEPGFGMDAHMLTWLGKVIDELTERLVEDAAVAGAVGSAMPVDYRAAGARPAERRGGVPEATASADVSDSGDGSGRWIVEKIVGLSADSCIYHLRNHPPAAPHPYPTDVWHVGVRFGSTVREYTPVSTAAEWEKGELRLLVKSYGTGTVSKRFAQLRAASKYGGAPFTGFYLEAGGKPRTLAPPSEEEQPCWVLLGHPMLTLRLDRFIHTPMLTGQLARPAGGAGDSEQAAFGTKVNAPAGAGAGAGTTAAAATAVAHICLVVGGTGVAPALQILRQVAPIKGSGAADVSGSGVLAADCHATLLYSSHAAEDVLCIDELRAVQDASGGRVAIYHTLTSTRPAAASASGSTARGGGGGGGAAAVAALASAGAAAGTAAGAAASATAGSISPALLTPSDPNWIPDRHQQFKTKGSHFKPLAGPLRTGPGAEASWHGRIDKSMMVETLPPPGNNVYVVVCGPPTMWEDIKAALLQIGHVEGNLVELKS